MKREIATALGKGVGTLGEDPMKAFFAAEIMQEYTENVTVKLIARFDQSLKNVSQDLR